VTKRILVVDDEPTIRELVAEALRDAGYEVDTAANGADALGVLHGRVPDAIVLDLMMPKLDGSGLVGQLRRNARYSTVPVLLVTAAYEAQEVAVRLGAHGCLSKPFELDALVGLVDQLVGEPIAL
jgi:DNA-binding response OmpR family regulator